MMDNNISIAPLTTLNYPNKIHADTLLEMDENPFFTIEHPNITITPALQKLDHRMPDKFMAILWNPGGYYISIKRNTTAGYLTESDYARKSINLKIKKYAK